MGPDKRPGGRSARVGEAVIAATLDELAETGFEQLTVDAVARRAAVHKTTIYRRWGSKGQLVEEALLARSAATVTLTDTGSLRSDLIAVGQAIVANLSSPLGLALSRAMISAGDTPEIGRITEEYWQERFDLVGDVVARAVARGELADGTDPDALIEAVVAPLWFRLLVSRMPTDDHEVDLVVDRALAQHTKRP